MAHSRSLAWFQTQISQHQSLFCSKVRSSVRWPHRNLHCPSADLSKGDKAFRCLLLWFRISRFQAWLKMDFRALKEGTSTTIRLSCYKIALICDQASKAKRAPNFLPMPRYQLPLQPIKRKDKNSKWSLRNEVGARSTLCFNSTILCRSSAPLATVCKSLVKTTRSRLQKIRSP